MTRRREERKRGKGRKKKDIITGVRERERSPFDQERGEEEIYINIYGNRRNFKQKRRDSKEKKKEENLRPLTNWVFVCLLN